jgi:hypothetical protein
MALNKRFYRNKKHHISKHALIIKTYFHALLHHTITYLWSFTRPEGIQGIFGGRPRDMSCWWDKGCWYAFRKLSDQSPMLCVTLLCRAVNVRVMISTSL